VRAPRHRAERPHGRGRPAEGPAPAPPSPGKPVSQQGSARSQPPALRIGRIASRLPLLPGGARKRHGEPRSPLPQLASPAPALALREGQHRTLTCCTAETEPTASPAASPAYRPAAACETPERRSLPPGLAEGGWRQRESREGRACP